MKTVGSSSLDYWEAKIQQHSSKLIYSKKRDDEQRVADFNGLVFCNSCGHDFKFELIFKIRIRLKAKGALRRFMNQKCWRLKIRFQKLVFDFWANLRKVDFMFKSWTKRNVKNQLKVRLKGFIFIQELTSNFPWKSLMEISAIEKQISANFCFNWNFQFMREKN